MKFMSTFPWILSDFFSQEQSIVCHQNCYKPYTSKHNLEPFMKKGQEDFVIPPSDDEGMQKKTRSIAPKLDWKLCMFCQKLTYKRDQKLSTVMTTDAGETIRNCANRKGDEVFLKKICGVDLIAQEATYHKGCHSAYLRMKKDPSEFED